VMEDKNEYKKAENITPNPISAKRGMERGVCIITIGGKCCGYCSIIK
jgi:hypothetical protein